MALHSFQTKAANVPMVVRFSSGHRKWVSGIATVLGWSEVLRQRAMDATLTAALNGLGLDLGAHEHFTDAVMMSGSRPVRVSVYTTEGIIMTLDLPQKEIPELAATANPETSPDLDIPEFPVVVTREGEVSETTSFTSKIDFDTMRNAFFQLEDGDGIEVARFLMKWGEWGDVYDNRISYIPNYPERPYVGVLVCQRLWELQNYLRKNISVSAKTWFKQAPPRGLDPNGGGIFPRGVITFEEQCFVVADRLLTNVLLDMTSVERLADKRYRFCAECGGLYEHKTAHKRKYCDKPQCGTRARVRALRKRNRRAEAVQEKGLPTKRRLL